MARTPDLAAIARHPSRGVEKLNTEAEIFAYLAAMFASWDKNCSPARNFLTSDQVQSLRPGEQLSGEIDYMHEGLVYASTFGASTRGLADGTIQKTVCVTISNGADPATRSVRSSLLRSRNADERKRSRARCLESLEGEVFAHIGQFVLAWFGGEEQTNSIVSTTPFFNGTDVDFEYTWKNAAEKHETIVFEISYKAGQGEEVEDVDSSDEGEGSSSDEPQETSQDNRKPPPVLPLV